MSTLFANYFLKFDTNHVYLKAIWCKICRIYSLKFYRKVPLQETVNLIFKLKKKLCLKEFETVCLIIQINLLTISLTTPLY